MEAQNPHLPFMTSLNLPDITKLINDPIAHDASWPNMPDKLLSDIAKFEEKQGNGLTNHNMYFHL